MSAPSPPTSDASSTPNSLESTYNPSNKYYFSGKMIVLLVEKTSFRVHQDLLIRSSQIFADTLMVPDGENNSQTLDGHPVIQLTDTEEEWDIFLDVFYGSVEADSLEDTSLGNVLRIANKYIFNKISKTCESYLQQKVFPYDRTSGHWFSNYIPYVKIVLEHNLLYMMPQAFYEAASLEVTEIITLFKKTRPELLVKFLAGRDKIATVVAGFAADGISGFLEGGCTVQDESCSGIDAFLHYTTKMAPQWRTRYEPLAELQSIVSGAEIDRLCNTCREKVGQASVSFQAEIWADLPSVFGLAESWAELQKYRIE
ncbi:hypothetical protein M422DRAFT_253619 [Sphaerobolus stellatus SS14]|uniref:Unplaced genomic scaffold SPHSTscaffold_50, whole genome shotgun sequence n=1 Tax=Sphaerobolus stellatus (strain SS14) TaxID=990650 RepID=A0A0C9VXG0_SPHS4|nr:hypothetical protein M422DRAFT_253619 [Sphaerobolus stellatus SS14]